ncbi:hypothetical protein GW846_05640 [Candidatus Gracilibacteria bacterium]|nr:hypothetical protein [Candidatus Gracilibacteria bacterium]
MDNTKRLGEDGSNQLQQGSLESIERVELTKDKADRVLQLGEGDKEAVGAVIFRDFASI